MWPWLLSVVGITAMWLAGSKRWQGWVVGLVCESLWCVYAVRTAQYGFIAAAVAYSAVYVRNLLTWRHTPAANVLGGTREVGVTPDGIPVCSHWPQCEMCQRHVARRRQLPKGHT